MARVPIATYRLQFHRDFTFAGATAILDYLAALGISDVYASPVLSSRRGSTHGYDGTDPSRIDPDLGGDDGFTLFQQELQKRGMGLLLDIVPNHMAASGENRWWMDVLENGSDSPFAAYFDVDWHPEMKGMDGRVLLPVLGKPFGEVLDAGELAVVLEEGKFAVKYFEHLFPVAPRSYSTLLRPARKPLRDLLGEESTEFQELEGALAAFEMFSAHESAKAGEAAERRMQFAALAQRLRDLLASAEILRIVRDSVTTFNGGTGQPASFNELQALLAEQHYKLAYWQNVNDSINYRRFFAITELVGMRVEDPLVFDALHDPLLRLAAKDVLTGVRVDHIDGLKDPAAYLARLQQRLAGSAALPAAVENGATAAAYVLVEKILARNETLPDDWPVSGTTGYEYLNAANGVFVDAARAAEVERIYTDFTGKDARFPDVSYQKKKLVMNTLLGVEMRSLGRQLGELAAQDRYARESPRASLLEALIETTACLPVYRTYIRSLAVPPEARAFIERALADARERKPHLAPAAFDFLRDVLLLENPAHVFAGQREARLAFVLRWQQFTGPIVAKGLEDTALYVYHPLLSLNEVGGDPQVTHASTRDELWEFLRAQRERWPHTLNAGTTHDTKRSEDVRARINVLSEISAEWESRLHRWAEWNSRHKEKVDGQLVPDRNEEYFLYQTLLGAWPSGQRDADRSLDAAFVKRIQEYLVKALREAMVYTRWTKPNEAHEGALQNFVAKILAPESAPEFLRDLRAFQKHVAYFGMVNSLGQTLIKMTAPGVPDFFQGSELWDLRLVDPDNRQPVDFAARLRALQEIETATLANAQEAIHDLAAAWEDGKVKLFLIRKTLGFRRQHAALFAQGEFFPAEVRGPGADHVLAFFRCHENDWSLTVAPRWQARLLEREDKWAGTEIVLPPNAPHSWLNVLTGARSTAAMPDSADERPDEAKPLAVKDLLADFPVALLESASSLSAV